MGPVSHCFTMTLHTLLKGITNFYYWKHVGFWPSDMGTLQKDVSTKWDAPGTLALKKHVYWFASCSSVLYVWVLENSWHLLGCDSDGCHRQLHCIHRKEIPVSVNHASMNAEGYVPELDRIHVFYTCLALSWFAHCLIALMLVTCVKLWCVFKVHRRGRCLLN